MSNYFFHANFPAMGRTKGRIYKKTVAIRLDDELAAILEKMAKEEDRPLGAMIRIVLRQALEAQKETKGKAGK
jgi:predicted transcriptional regulator